MYKAFFNQTEISYGKYYLLNRREISNQRAQLESAEQRQREEKKQVAPLQCVDEAGYQIREIHLQIEVGSGNH